MRIDRLPLVGSSLLFSLALPLAAGAQIAGTPQRVDDITLSERAEEASFVFEGPSWIANPGEKPPNPALIGRCIVRAFASEPEVGFSYAINRGGALAASGAGGWARAPWETVDPSVPMTADKRMTIASLSKPLTAVAVMVLLEENGLDLDDPFYPLISSEYAGLYITPQGQWMNIPAFGVNTVTIRNLLTHRSGLKPGLGCGKLHESLGTNLPGTPGVTYDYENANFCLLREVIEHVSGMDYVDYVQTKVLTPMGITGMSCKPDTVKPALYYNTIGSAGKSWGDYSTSCSAYGWYASAKQLAKFLAGVNFETVLTATSTHDLISHCPNGATNGYCLGWQRSTVAGIGTYNGHGGDWIASGCGGDCNRGFNGTVRRFPHTIDAVLLVNTRGGAGGNPTLTSESTILNNCYLEALALAN